VKFFKKLARWILRDELLTLFKINAILQERLTTARDDRSEMEKSKLLSEQECEGTRALLTQLRVRQTNEAGRTGWAVTAFIPEEVLERIRPDVEKRKRFREKVIKILVGRALYGLYHVTQPGNRVCCVTFEKLGTAPPILSAWKENQKRPIIFKENGDGSKTELKKLPGQSARNFLVEAEELKKVKDETPKLVR
jgi:hypothetical protein